MNESELQEMVGEAGTRFEVPGVAVGVLHEDAEHYAFHGVTSIENPLPVDADTLFQFGSTGKTFTSTAVLRLVERGDVDLDAPVRRYVPELRLQDEDVAERVTVLHLFNHTAGWAGDQMDNTGDGDDALERYVTKMADLAQVTPLGSAVSYNNASLSLAGRIIEKVTGSTFEAAIKELIFEPLGMTHSFFFPNEVMTRRFVVGHERHPDGRITVARPWSLPRGTNPAGGISSNAGDQLIWARFHLGDGRAADGTRILSSELLDRMKVPTAAMPGSALGDAVGISWLLREKDGVLLVGHGGSTNGQLSAFMMVPARRTAVAVLTNSAPNGAELHAELVRLLLDAYAGVDPTVEEPEIDETADLTPYVGRYETLAAWVEVTAVGTGLELQVEIRPEVRAALREAGSAEADEKQPPIPVGLVVGDGDRYAVTGGEAKGMTGYFSRNAGGAIDGIHVGGRLAVRVSSA